MAIGPGIYFNNYKNCSIEELQKQLDYYNSKEWRQYIKGMQREQDEKGIDDSSAVSDNKTKKDVIDQLIQFKTKFPDCNLSQLDYWDIKRALETGDKPSSHFLFFKLNRSKDS